MPFHPFPGFYRNTLLEVSSNGRYLVRGGAPFLIVCDSPQGMMVCLDETDMETWFSTRAGQGFNSSQVHVIAGASFGGNADRSTFDDIDPFNTPGDISTPNSTYFARLDAMVQLAYDYGIYLFLTAAETIDSLTLWKTNGNSKCYAFGQYLGNRYAAWNNICWVVGNDFQTWESDQDAVDACVNVLDGIQNTAPNHSIYGAWLDYFVSASRDSSDFNAETTLDWGYSYYIAYDIIATEYALTPAKPVYLCETYYENEAQLGLSCTDLILRKQNYGAMLAGACGFCYMNDYWGFKDSGWEAALSSQAVTEVGLLKALFESYDWWLMVPDTTHTVLTSGYATWATGTVQPDANEFAYCGWITDGSLAMIYMSNNRTMTVDMSEFNGSVTCRWYDPTSGDWTVDAASPHANSGTHDFSRSASNDQGDPDWVLVLET